MFYRAFVVGIVIFWGWMTCLLVRMEWSAGAGEAMSIPPSYVWKLMFLHEEGSDLVVYNGRQRLGSVHLQPRRGAGNGAGGGRALTGYGNFVVDLPGVPRQNAGFHGTLHLDQNNEAQQFQLTAVLRQPKQRDAGITLDLDGSPVTGRWHYAVRQGTELIRESTGTVAELLDVPELRALPFDPRNLLRAEQEQISRVTVSAHRGKLSMNGDDIETFVVSIKDGNGLENTVNVNPLGQVLAVKTFAGFNLLDEALSP